MKKTKNALSAINKIIEKNSDKGNKQYLDAIRAKFAYENLEFKILNKNYILYPNNKIKSQYLNHVIGVLSNQLYKQLGKNYNSNAEKHFLSQKQLSDLREDIFGKYNKAYKIEGFPIAKNAFGKEMKLFKLGKKYKKIIVLLNRMDKKEKNKRDVIFNTIHPILKTEIGKIVGSNKKKYGDLPIFKSSTNDIVNDTLSTIYHDLFMIDDIAVTKIGNIQVLQPKYGERWFASNLINSILLTEGFKVKEVKFLNGPQKGSYISNRPLYTYVTNLLSTAGKKIEQETNNEINFSDMGENYEKSL